MDGQKSTPTSARFPGSELVAFGVGGTNLVTITIVTKQGSIYSFPDMPLAELKRVLPETGRTPTSSPSLMMVNASGSTLLVEFRIIQNVSVDEEILWASRA